MDKLKTLKPDEDAFGQMIWTYYRGGEVFEIVERDDGYTDVGSKYGPKMYFSEYEIWSFMEQKAMESVRERVLDVGCGSW